MAVVTKWFGVPFKNLVDGSAVWDWNTDTIKVALCTNAYTPDQDAHDFFNDVTNELGTGSGYTAGGLTISSPTITYDTATNEIRLDCADPAWAASTLTARYAIVYKSTGVASTSPLICYIDFGADASSSSGTFTIILDATGLIKGTAS